MFAKELLGIDHVLATEYEQLLLELDRVEMRRTNDFSEREMLRSVQTYHNN